MDLTTIEDASQIVDRRTLHDHIHRIEKSLDSDPAQAVGSAKELIETVAKQILSHYRDHPDKYDTIQKLVKQTLKRLNLAAEEIPEASKGADSMRQVLSALGGIAELRNRYGTGHGRTRTCGLDARHARLVVGAAATLARFLLETLDARKSESE